MRSRRKLKPSALLLAVLIPFVFIAATPAITLAGQRSAETVSFRKLGLKLRTITASFGRIFMYEKTERTTKSRAKTKARVAVKAQPRAVAKQATPVVASTPKKAKPAEAALPEPPKTERIVVISSGPFQAELNGQNISFEANRAPAVAYDGGKYFLVEGDKTLGASDKPIKFKPAAPDSILSLPNYTDMNWNNKVNLNSFRGNIELAYSRKTNQLWAVNELPLEDYLAGMAEAQHSSAEEHLKVMAIVSRSYAVHHLAKGGRHAGEPFHLKNSRNGNGDDQVYRGHACEMRQPRIAEAVRATAGTVVTYQGNTVITPYSSRASGRTRTPREAGWNYSWPWVRSVPDPDTEGMTRLGHGVGLSGYGSRKRAERGDSAAQIITHYFPGTALGQTDTAGQIVRVAIYAVK